MVSRLEEGTIGVVKMDIDYSKLDPRIRTVVKGLGEVGFETEHSCSGHLKKGKLKGGYISLKGSLSREDLEEVLVPLGVSSFELESCSVYTSVPGTVIRFSGLGGSKGRGRKPRVSKLDLSEEQVRSLLFLFGRNLSKVGIHHSSRVASLSRYALSRAIGGVAIQDLEGEAHKQRGF